MPREWTLITKARNGTVSILRDLTLEECRAAYERLDPCYGMIATVYETKDGGTTCSSSLRSVNDGDIEVREVVGPKHWNMKEMNEWQHWPKIEEIKLDDPRHLKNIKYGDIAMLWKANGILGSKIY